MHPNIMEKVEHTDEEAQDISNCKEGKHLEGKHLRPNHDLSLQEKSQKHDLKRLLKRQMRRKKLETRLQQSIIRKDAATEDFSRKELKQFLDDEERESLKTVSLLAPTKCLISEIHCEISQQEIESHQQDSKARLDVEFFYQRYYAILGKREREEKNRLRASAATCAPTNIDWNLDAATLRVKQTAEARVLLQNMTKGRQQIHMFENHTALMGYVRQKFQERASLAISSLTKLDPRRYHPQVELQQKFWNQLLKVRSICSIGCGPGCDAVGNIKFLEHFAGAMSKNTVVDRIVFLDWTMEKWRFFLQPLIDELLVPEGFTATADVAFCDVLKPLSDSSNAWAKKLLLENPHDRGDKASQVESSSIDLFVTSYLLTETRGKWRAFYQETVAMAKPGSLFLHAEPTAWQLLTLIEKTQTIIQWAWLDSSMYSPILQAIEGRAGPAVLLGMKL